MHLAEKSVASVQRNFTKSAKSVGQTAAKLHGFQDWVSAKNRERKNQGAIEKLFLHSITGGAITRRFED
jgi:hypothetical protein